MTTENKQTIAQFKAWIEGVEEMQKSDWHPSKSQWEKIRAKIDALVESVTTRRHSPSGIPVPSIPQAMEIPAPIGALDTVEIVDTGVENTSVPKRMPEKAPLTGVNALTKETVGVDGQPVLKSTTPNIDTSKGNYDSPFE